MADPRGVLYAVKCDGGTCVCTCVCRGGGGGEAMTSSASRPRDADVSPAFFVVFFRRFVH